MGADNICCCLFKEKDDLTKTYCPLEENQDNNINKKTPKENIKSENSENFDFMSQESLNKINNERTIHTIKNNIEKEKDYNDSDVTQAIYVEGIIHDTKK